MKRIFTIILSAGALVSLASCTKAGGYSHSEGEEVTFNTTVGDAASKLHYGTGGSSTAQPVFWDTTDKLLIGCAQCTEKDGAPQVARYIVSGVDGSDNRKATIFLDPEFGPKGLRWGTGEHTFYAVCPATASVTLTKEGTITATTNQIQAQEEKSAVDGNYTYAPDMDNNFMVVGKAEQEAGNGTEDTFLQMKPFTTVFEITLVNKYSTKGNMKVTSASLTSSADDGWISGAYTADMTNYLTDGLPEVTPGETEGGKTVKATFTGTDAVEIGYEKSITFYLFCMPSALKLTKLTLTVGTNETGSGSDTFRSLQLREATEIYGEKGNWLEFERGSLVRLKGIQTPEGITWLINGDVVSIAGFKDNPSGINVDIDF